MNIGGIESFGNSTVLMHVSIEIHSLCLQQVGTQYQRDLLSYLRNFLCYIARNISRIQYYACFF